MSYPRRDTAHTAQAAVSVGVASGTVAAANSDRLSLYISNDHATQVIYLALGPTAVINAGIRLNAAGGAVYINDYTGIVTGIATGAATPALVAEL